MSIKKHCSFCLNASVDPCLSPDNDLSYMSVGDMASGYSMYLRTGSGKSTVLVISKWDQELRENLDIGFYKMKYCPECGRKLIENHFND